MHRWARAPKGLTIISCNTPAGHSQSHCTYMIFLGLVRYSKGSVRVVLAFLSLGAAEMFSSHTTTVEVAQTTRSLGEGDVCLAPRKIV